MAIVLGLLAALAGVGVWWWRLQMAADAARGVADAAGEVRGFWRRMLWNRKAGRNQLDMVDDPREAAAAMLVVLAQYDGALTDAEQTLIKQQMHDTFDASGSEAEELLARGRWLARDTGVDPAQALRRLSGSVEKQLDIGERQELLTMLRSVVAGGAPSTVLDQAVAELERRLLPRNEPINMSAGAWPRPSSWT